MKPAITPQPTSDEKGSEIKSLSEKDVIDYVLTRKAAFVLRAINNKFRRKIIDLLHE